MNWKKERIKGENGRVERWKGGRMEGWKDGIMEEWRKLGAQGE
jgi:hypothetical protein